MRQKELRTVVALTNGGTKASAGANTHAVALALTVGTKPLIDSDLDPLILSTNAHLTGRGTLRDLRDALKLQVDATYDVAFSIRDSLKRSLGRQYSPAWEGTGFNQSLEIPRSVAGLESISRSLKNYFVAHPELEVAEVATSVIAGAASDALVAAETAVTVQAAAVRTLLTARRQREKKMRQRLRGIAEELNRVIGPLDARWEAFGLNQPGLQQVPDRPGKVIVVLQAGGAAAVKWQKTPRAGYYRLWLKVIGVDQEAIPVGSPMDVDFMIETMPSASQVEVSISAVNNGGESARSEVVLVITP